MENRIKRIGLVQVDESNDPDVLPYEKEVSPLENTELGPLEWTEEYLRSKGISYHYKTNSFFLHGAILEDSLVTSELRLGLYQHGQTHLKSYIPDALRMVKRKEAKESIDNLKFTLTFDKYSSVNVDNILSSIGNLTELDCKVFKHWLWLVKRKLYGLSTDHELMLVLYGKSGAGKSYFLRKLLEPLLMVTSFTDMRIFNDQFGLRQFTRNRVMVFDELDMVSEVSVEKLKNVITAQEISWRVLRSEATMSGRQNCSFVATTNIPVNEQIKDSTSARRYWQIDTCSKLNWDFINSFDFRKLWRSIDETRECPITPHLDEVLEVQNKVILYRDDIDNWIDEKVILKTDGDTFPTSTELYENFNDYCRQNDIKNIFSRNKFCRDLSHKLQLRGLNNFKQHKFNGSVWKLNIKK